MRGGGTHKSSECNKLKSKIFENIISLDNLFAAWTEFKRGKSKRRDVLEFEYRLEDNVFALHEELSGGVYRHGPYEEFYVNDPKRRHIHKASVRDRLLHHAVVRVIEPLFEKSFIFDSWSCRKGKGTHRAVDRFQRLAWKLSRNGTRTVWVLHLDVKSYFASVDQSVLLELLGRRIRDAQAMGLLAEIVRGFPAGMPLGNLTSQLFANVCLNELDRFAKHSLKAKNYLRYCDDFVFLSESRGGLSASIATVRDFLATNLRLALHPGKIILKPYHGGVDWLGFVRFPQYRVLRTATKRRMLKSVNNANWASYLGLLVHCRSYGIGMELDENRPFGYSKPHKWSA